MADKWSLYVPDWRPNDRLDVDGPLNYDGEGEITERTDTVIGFHLKMPEVHPFLFGHIAAMDIQFRAEYLKEGDGNKAHAVVNGKEIDDNNVIVQSGPDARAMQSSVLIQGRKLVVRVHSERDYMYLRIDGHDFRCFDSRLCSSYPQDHRKFLGGRDAVYGLHLYSHLYGCRAVFRLAGIGSKFQGCRYAPNAGRRPSEYGRGS